MRNARSNGGKRIDAENRTAGWWRRQGQDDKLWIIGDVDVGADDILFLDSPSQDARFEPPWGEPQFQFEHDLAHGQDFIAALADDTFATLAHDQLVDFEWVKVGTDEVGKCRSVHALIAALRNKGEDYLDYKDKFRLRLPASQEAAYIARITEILLALGWRRFTPDELRSRAYADFRRRVDARVAAWRRMADYEARPSDSHAAIEKIPAARQMINYVTDDLSWLPALKGEEGLATSFRYFQRLKALGQSGRLAQTEFRDLCSAIG